MFTYFMCLQFRFRAVSIVQVICFTFAMAEAAAASQRRPIVFDVGRLSGGSSALLRTISLQNLQMACNKCNTMTMSKHTTRTLFETIIKQM